MNRRNRHMQYRRSIYRKSRIRTVAVSTVIAVIAVFIAFMVIGTLLHSKTQPDTSGGTEKPQDKNESPLTSAQAVGAYALPLLEDGSTFSNRLSAIPQKANAVCIGLNSEDGKLLFKSSLAAELSHLSVHSDASALSGSITSIERSDLYISALLYIPSFDQDDRLLREVELATWGAIACEAIEEGVGDVLLVAPQLDSENVPRICELADSIHAISKNGIVGLVLPDSVLEDENKLTLVNTLSKHFNYLALDTTEFKSEDDPIEYIEGRVSQLQLDLMYYKMRVLLPKSTDSEVQEKYIEAVTKYNITSWQILP